jgi:hypothetical protein
MMSVTHPEKKVRHHSKMYGMDDNNPLAVKLNLKNVE